MTLERRLDNVVYRLGLADSRPQARQLVRHGHFTLNGHNHNVPSYLVEIGDVIAGARRSAAATATSRPWPITSASAPCRNGCSSMRTSWSAAVVGMPDRQAIDIPLKEQLIVEYYSR